MHRNDELRRADWDSGTGPRLNGGRWNPKGFAVVYGSIDPATAIHEVGAHVGLDKRDSEARTLTRFTLPLAACTVVKPRNVPNPNWLVPGSVSRNQQDFGLRKLAALGAVLVPSVSSRNSWNVFFDPERYALVSQEHFPFDTRLVAAA